MLLFYLFKVITLDLKELKLNTKFYQRIKENFQCFEGKFNLLICWESNSRYFFLYYCLFLI